MTHSGAQVATAHDADRVVGTIMLAFVADPVMRWLYPKPFQYLAGFPKLVRALGGGAFEKGSAHETSDLSGAAIWLRPGVHPDKALVAHVIEGTVGVQQASRVFEALDQLDRYHPAEPHWYLPFIGVDAPRRGAGLGSLLLLHALSQADRERAPAYLETGNSANIPLYRRHGFELAATITLPSTPILFPMVRPAR